MINTHYQTATTDRGKPNASDFVRDENKMRPCKPTLHNIAGHALATTAAVWRAVTEARAMCLITPPPSHDRR